MFRVYNVYKVDSIIIDEFLKFKLFSANVKIVKLE